MKSPMYAPLKKSYSEDLNDLVENLMKGGEGSKGGKVIGHTKTGKPVYDSHGHKGHADFTPQEHKQAAKISDKKSDAADEKAGTQGSKEGDKHFDNAEGHRSSALKQELSKKKVPTPPTNEKFSNMSSGDHYKASEKHYNMSKKHEKAGNKDHSEMHRKLYEAHNDASHAHNVKGDMGEPGSPRHADRTEQAKDHESSAFRSLGEAQSKHSKLGSKK